MLIKEILEARKLPANSMKRIRQAEDDFAKQVYGDEYGKKNDKYSNLYFPNGESEVYNNADIAGGLFSIGNAKLADNQTLIMNFTSALGCPSMNDCPITQKACYAVAGENRLKDTRRKNLIVQNLVMHARANNLLKGLFDIAELYIIESIEHTGKPIKFIRYNEAGDFDDQNMLVMAAEFSKKVRDKYNVLSMAYTANPRLDPSVEVDGEPIDTIIAINRSRNDIPTSPQSLNRNFFGIPMQNFSTNPEINLENAYCDVEYVEDSDLNQLKVELPLQGKYICPCSFWKYNKDKAITKFLIEKGYMQNGQELPNNKTKAYKTMMASLTQEDKDALKNILNKIISPCGIKCAVCHDIEGGVTKDGKKLVTPKSDSILPSITRRSLVEVAKKYLGLEVEERRIAKSELKDFAECGLCGTAAVISPIGKIVDHGTEICLPSGMEKFGPVLQKLYDTLTGIQMGRIEAPEGWIMEIC